jgi:enoyl-CoA hydratase
MVEVSDDGTVTTITMDDGKVNALGPATQQALFDAFDAAESAGNAIVLVGRPGRFSAGFDLEVMAAGGQTAIDMVIGGFRLARRLLAHERPVVIGCTGHAVAMGAFLLLAGDLRIGASGDFKIVANEVAIGMTLPYSAVELMRHRLTPSAIQRSALLAETFDPQGAVAVGYLDRLVDPDDVVSAAREAATGAAALHPRAHAATKQRIRETTLGALAAAIERDRADLGTML